MSDFSKLLNLPEASKMSASECESCMVLMEDLQRIFRDTSSMQPYQFHVPDSLTRQMVSKIVNKVNCNGNWNLKGYTLHVDLEGNGTIRRIGTVKPYPSVPSLCNIILTLTQEHPPTWYIRMPHFLKKLLKAPVTVSSDFTVEKECVFLCKIKTDSEIICEWQRPQ